jgi:glycolate oxidase iron-sulfur subunit
VTETGPRAPAVPELNTSSSPASCGFCLPTCPTYAENGLEMDSPRGRIVLIKALADGRLGLTDPVVDHLSLCLDCRACESACPAGVQYGHLIEATRAEIERRRPGSALRRLVRQVAFTRLLPNPALLRGLATALRLYQRSGLQALVRGAGSAPAPGHPGGVRGLLPPLPPASERGLPDRVPAAGAARAGFLHGCVQDVVFRAHNLATLRLLTRNGVEVAIPRAQRCCGALHAHAGDPERARALARENIAAFEAAEVDTIVVNAAGCGRT